MRSLRDAQLLSLLCLRMPKFAWKLAFMRIDVPKFPLPARAISYQERPQRRVAGVCAFQPFCSVCSVPQFGAFALLYSFPLTTPPGIWPTEIGKFLSSSNTLWSTLGDCPPIANEFSLRHPGCAAFGIVLCNLTDTPHWAGNDLHQRLQAWHFTSVNKIPSALTSKYCPYRAPHHRQAFCLPF